MPTRVRSIISQESDHSCPTTGAFPNRVALLLAGGDGRRLQELTSEIAGAPIPKQYCRLLRDSTLLEATISRARLFASCERISVVINQDHIGLARDQIKSLPRSNVIVQPLNRDTGPGMIFALLQLERAHPDAMVAVFPTDHYVDRDSVFVAHVLRAVNTQYPACRIKLPCWVSPRTIRRLNMDTSCPLIRLRYLTRPTT